MPNPQTALQDGLRYERGGVLDKALDSYQVAAVTATEPAIVAEALRHQADVYRATCQWELALAAARRSAEVAESARLSDLFAEALNAEALVYHSRGEFEAAVPLLERILEVSTDARIRGIALQNLGSIAAARRDFAVAEERFRGSYRCFQKAGYLRGAAIARNNYARSAIEQGKYAFADTLCQKAVAAAHAVGDLELVYLATLNHAEVLAALGEFARAEDQASAALGYFANAGNAWRRIECLRLLGDVRAQQGDLETAVRCYQQGRQLADSIGARFERAQLDERLAAAGPPAPPVAP